MIKKFFSIMLLVASVGVNSAFGKALTISNNNNAQVNSVVINYAKSALDQSSDICVKSLDVNQSGVSELEDVNTIKLYSVKYTINNETVTLDFKGKEIYLPATINLTDINTHSVTWAESVENRTKAEEAALLHQASVVARNAKNGVVGAFTDTKDWIVEKTVNVAHNLKNRAVEVKDTAKALTHDAAQAIADRTEVTSEKALENANAIENVPAQIKETASNAAQNLQDKAVEVKDTTKALTHDAAQTVAEKTEVTSEKAQENANAIENVPAQIEETALETVHAAQEKATKAKHRTQEAAQKIAHKTEEAAA